MQSVDLRPESRPHLAMSPASVGRFMGELWPWAEGCRQANQHTGRCLLSPYRCQPSSSQSTLSACSQVTQSTLRLWPTPYLNSTLIGVRHASPSPNTMSPSALGKQ